MDQAIERDGGGFGGRGDSGAVGGAAVEAAGVVGEGVVGEAGGVDAGEAGMSEERRYPILVVSAVIIRDGYVLMERRAPAGVEGLDDMWDLPGGKVECGEIPVEALVREIREELRVQVQPMVMCPELKRSVWNYPGVGEKHWILAAYSCRIVDGDPACGDRLAWLDLGNLPRRLILNPDYEFVQWARCLGER